MGERAEFAAVVVLVAVMHGDLQQNMRTLIMEKFREGKIHFLVATDVVSRGIDVTNISHIVNFRITPDIMASGGSGGGDGGGGIGTLLLLNLFRNQMNLPAANGEKAPGK